MTDATDNPAQQPPPQTQTIIINPDQLYGANNTDDEIDLRELWNTIWAGKWIIAATTFIFAIVSVIVSLNMPNVYKSTTTLIPTTAEEQSGASALAARFGGLASMAGVSLGGSGVDKTSIAMQIIKSQKFLGDFIKRHDLKPQLLAAESWDAINNRLIFDKDIYNEKSNAWNWKSKSNWKKQLEPSDQEAVKELLANISVNVNAESGVINISASNLSPFIAQQWVQWLVTDINQHMRRQDIADATKSIHYLNKKLAETSISQMQQIFYELIEAQTKTKMLAEIRDQYILRAIDPATVPEQKYKPKRALIAISSALFGTLISIVFVLVRNFIVKKDP